MASSSASRNYDDGDEDDEDDNKDKGNEDVLQIPYI